MTDWSVPETHRNWVTWILFFLAVFAAISSFLDAARYMGWLSIASIGPIEFFVEDAQWIGAIAAGLIGVIWIVVAGWLWSQDPRGWIFVVVLAGLNVVFILLSLLGDTALENIWPALVINIAIIGLAFLPTTRQAFGTDPYATS